MKTESIFQDYFYAINSRTEIKHNNIPFNAEDFYNKVRCGLMHEARTKGEWLITAAGSNYPSAIFITEDKTANTKSINRTILQKRLKEYFKNDYLNDLKKEDVNRSKYGRLFARNLDHLFDVPRDLTFEWWEDH